MGKRFLASLLILFLWVSLPMGQEVKFNADSAYSYIEHLSVTIGPRPMGSSNERLAQQWAVEKFQQFGADSAFILPFTKAKTRRGNINTNSGVVVGIFMGQNDSSLLVGGHIDSDGPEIPGANDNASGAATAIELARIWGQRSRNFTMIFCAFGGEERGLIGSTYFVDHFGEIEKVKLMISTDMGGSPGSIITMFETDSTQAPRWLVKDALEIDKNLGFNRLEYPTHYSTLNTISKNGAGSDHMPFLAHGIPAIDFTTGINDFPIHTPQDKIDFISRSALDKYGKYVDTILQKYQEEDIPAESNSRFMLWKIFGINLFIPFWLIFAFNIFSILVGVTAFGYARANRLKIEKKDRIRFSGLKLFLLFIFIAIFAQFGEGFIQLFKGFRYSWITHFYTYMGYAFLWAIAGLWVSLQLTKKWKFSTDLYVYSKRFLIILLLFTILASLKGARLALYPALTLFVLSLAIFIKQSNIRAILAILAPFPLVRLLFHEVTPFVGKMLANSGFNITSTIKAFLFSALFVVVLIILLMPLIYSYGFAVVANNRIKNGLKIIRYPLSGGILLLVLIGFGIYLFTLPVYNEMWRPAIRVEANYKLPQKESELKIVGNEYFKDVKVSGDSLIEINNSRIHELNLPTNFAADWMAVSGTENVSNGQKDTVNYSWIISSDRPYMQIFCELRTDSGDIDNPISQQAFTHRGNVLRYSWYGDFGDTLMVEGNLVLETGAQLIRKVTAKYAEIPLDINVASELATVRYRTTIEYQDTLKLVKSLTNLD